MTFEEDAGAYDQKDAEGFIRLNALRLRLVAVRNARGRRAEEGGAPARALRVGQGGRPCPAHVAVAG